MVLLYGLNNLIISSLYNKFLELLNRTWFHIFLIFCVSFVTHFIYFGYPNSVVFDEVHIGRYITEYIKGAYVFDVHPPLGRLIFAGFAILFCADYITNFDNIGNILPNWAVLLRIIPILAGTILPVIIYLILKNLDLSSKLALLGAFLLCIENSLIIHSRFLLTDSFLILFGFISILLYSYYRNKVKYFNFYLLFSIIFASLAFSIKWTGLSFLFIIFALEFQNRKVKNYLKFAFSGLIIFFFVYSFVFSLNFVLLPNSGTGDPFMSSNFREKNFWSKFSELNIEMYRANTRLTKPHDYSSKWYSWPIMTRTVYYWNNDNTGSYLYLLGNPVIYYLGFASVLFLLIKRKLNNKSEYLVILGFLINFIPFIFIGRVMFLYHYQVALIFSVLALVILLNRIQNQKVQNKMIISLAILSFVFFIYFSPLTYGLPISKDTLESMMWIKSWR
jgi:dolichyl-phosphate-mannose-protein mannosyltransferase